MKRKSVLAGKIVIACLLCAGVIAGIVFFVDKLA